MQIPHIHPFSKEEIIAETQTVWQEMDSYVSSLSEPAFHHRSEEGKWTPAENMEHLFLSTKPLVGALKMPKITLLTFGKPNRPIRKFPELVKRYHERLAAVTDTRPVSGYGPDLSDKPDTASMREKWNSIGSKYIERIGKWKENDMDEYLLPHPLLGRLMVREMLFFTIYHTYHHLYIMQHRVEQWKEMSES